MNAPIISLTITYEQDVVIARQRARQIAALLGFGTQDQTRIATAVSEIARNAHQYGGGGQADFLVEGKTAPQVLTVRVADQGPGITDLARILLGQYHSATGMGLGILGARRLMDHFYVESAAGKGTTVWLKKLFPKRASLLTPQDVAAMAGTLARERPQSPLEEVQQQNQELLRTLEEVRARQEELTRLNSELEDTNRGVVALYAELDEKADHLRRADEMKTQFLSNMSHEFRTPLNSILALSRILRDRIDGGLTPEQERQVGFIRKAAEDLSELVNDLLDLAKVEAGKIVIRPIEFEVSKLFGALRGMLRPLLVNQSVNLVFEATRHIPPLYTDEGKVSQILRNFISNALKFTERGEVRVSANLAPGGDAVTFSVTDTGIGIAPGDQDRIFQEFSQLEHPLQRKVMGTGLGLPLTKQLTELLGGTVSVASEVGVGSTFSATVPRLYVERTPPHPATVETPRDPARAPILVVEDSPEDFLIYEKHLQGSHFQPLRAATLRQARDLLKAAKPNAVILDIRLRGEDAWHFLAELKAADDTRHVPVIVATSIEDQHKGMGLGADAYGIKPIERRWLLDTLDRLHVRKPIQRILAIDDDEASRYLLQGMLSDAGFAVTEAASGPEGIRRAREEQPEAIALDLEMPVMSGFEVLERLKADPLTQGIPVIIITSKVLEAGEYRLLAQNAVAILSKEPASPEAALAGIQEALARARRE